MDIDLLSKMVKELILDQDRVVLPGLGSFVAEIVPSTFSDKGYTINPPYRRLYFRSKPDEGDELVEFYASSNNIAPEMAGRIIKDFLAELKSVLHEKKTIVFPGLGRLRATKENHLFFVADEDLDIYPEGFGLEPVSLKTHQETPEQLTAAVADLRAMLAEREALQAASETVQTVQSEPEQTVQLEPEEVQTETVQQETISEQVEEAVPETEQGSDVEPAVEQEQLIEVAPEAEADTDMAVETVTAEEKPAVVQEPLVEEVLPTVKKKTPAWKVVLKVIIWLLIVAVVLLAAFVILGHMCPDVVDRFLYTPEEMEIVNIL